MKGVYRLSLMRKPCFKKPSNSLANNAFSYRADSDGDTMARETMWVVGSLIWLFTLGSAMLCFLGI